MTAAADHAIDSTLKHCKLPVDADHVDGIAIECCPTSIKGGAKLDVGDSYVEVRASRNVLSKAHAQKTRLPLPQTWIAEPRRGSIVFSPYLSLAVATFGIASMFTGKFMIGFIILVIFGAEAILLFRKSATQSALGPGRVTVSKEGFTDERLGEAFIRGDSIDRFRTVVLPRTGTLLGVRLWNNGYLSIPLTNPIYEKTYSLRRTRAC